MKCLNTALVLIVSLFLINLSEVGYAQSVAITMDNPNVDPTPLLSNKQRDKAILSTLNDNHLKIVLFVQGLQVDNEEGKQLLNRWQKAGHVLGNHTYSHWSLNNTDIEKYETDTLRNENILKNYSTFKKIFRFPFLKEGETAEKRDEFRKFLQANHYQNGSVTIDASDWYISDRLEKKLSLDSHADLTPYKKYYLKHIWNRAQYYDQLAMKVLGRSPNHTLLVHHNLLNALFLGDLIKMFQSKGWKIINADQAFKDPLFKMQPNTVPAGESIIWALAKQTGKYDKELRYPGEDESYEKEAMDKLGL